MIKKKILPIIALLTIVIIITFIILVNNKNIDPHTVIYTRSNISKVNIYAGEAIRYNMKIIYKNDINLSFNGISFDDTEDISRIISSNTVLKDKGSYTEQNTSYELSFYDTGKFVISGFNLEYTANNKKEIINGEDIDITVLAFSDGETLPPLNEPLKIKTPWYIYVFILLLIVLIALGIFFIVRRLRKKDKEINLIEIDEDKNALILLDNLYSKNYVRLNMQTNFYFELTEIFKNYLSSRFSIGVAKMTTKEFILYSDKNIIPEYEDIVSFLEFSDYVKFAKKSTDQRRMEGDFYFCKDYIIKHKNKKCLQT